jgi:hypothetical protein
VRAAVLHRSELVRVRPRIRGLWQIRNVVVAEAGSTTVDNPVDCRWNGVGYAEIDGPGGCFCCRFGNAFLWIKNRLPKAGLPTMLCVQQPHEHNM